LGTTEATPLEVATAYTAFAAGGRLVRPTPLARVEGAAEESGFGGGADAAQVLKPSTSYMLTDMLGAVIERGTARAARGALRGVAAAGKTGTARDGWFAGYTPNLVCVVWVGFDDGGELDLTGADAALPAWTEFVRRAVELRPELGGAEFARPASVTFVEIDPETGLVASPSCPQRERVALAPAFVPNHECSLHGDPWGLMALAASSAPAGLTPTAQVQAPAVVTYDATPTRTYEVRPALSTRTSDERPPALREATRATRVEVGRDGRRRLASDVSVAPKSPDDWQE
ncbi:MAG TPA: penicillin-binding transpeptidase domain-containing protein, partial [Pyrinomonadaceae bacterium]|nr:penicillin-binding transpeptidase domain-containing protein [Pyrinomonadaceae bacterium]